jgi:hypothetical protein
MPRSPYYPPRKRTRIQSTKQIQAAKANGEGGPTGSVPCAVCHANLPCILERGTLYVQAGLGCVGGATQEEVCPFFADLADGNDHARHAALSFDRLRAEVYPAFLGRQNVVRSGRDKQP